MREHVNRDLSLKEVNRTLNMREHVNRKILSL